MPVTVVVGGQFGSEGKGKVAQYLAKRDHAAAVVRVGGSNSGHTAVADDGARLILRQLPTAAVYPDIVSVIGPGSYIDLPVLLREIERLGVEPSQLKIDRNAFIVSDEDRAAEIAGDLRVRIGSTNSGTGAAVRRRIDRRSDAVLAGKTPELAEFTADTTDFLRSALKRSGRVIVEGTQGFGLSLLHSPHYPYTTSRDTSAAGAVAEAGLSPRDVDQVVLVIRAFPIRVAGNSGPLQHETTWEDVTVSSRSPEPLSEYTSVTGTLRRIARFDPEIVRRAVAVNDPSSLVMNHVDYIDSACARQPELTADASSFVTNASRAIGRAINLVGTCPEPMFLAGDPPYAVLAS